MIIAKTELYSPVFEQPQTKFLPTIKPKSIKNELNYVEKCVPVADFSQEITPERKILHIKINEESSGLTLDDVHAAIDRFRQRGLHSS